jgi:hypothetical protein
VTTAGTCQAETETSGVDYFTEEDTGKKALEQSQEISQSKRKHVELWSKRQQEVKESEQHWRIRRKSVRVKMEKMEKMEKKKKKKKKKRKKKKKKTKKESGEKSMRRTKRSAAALGNTGDGFGPEYSSDDAGDGPEYVQWGDQLVTKRQMRLILANSEKWEFYLQLKVTSEDWWADPEKIYKAMERNMSSDYFEIFRKDVEEGRIGDLIGFHDFLRGFENSPLGVKSVPVEKLTRSQEIRARGVDWDFYSRCTGGSWIIGAWELLGKIKMMDKDWSEEDMQAVIDTVAEEFEREVRDEDLSFDEFVRLRVRIWRRRQAKKELRRAWQQLVTLGRECGIVTTNLKVAVTNGSDHRCLDCAPEFESDELPLLADICWNVTKGGSRGPRRVKRSRRYECKRPEKVVRIIDKEERIKKRPAKSSRSTFGRSVVKKIWKVQGRRRKRMKRRGRAKPVKMSKPWKTKKSREVLICKAAQEGFGYRKRELHGLRPLEAWLAWTSARDGIG